MLGLYERFPTVLHGEFLFVSATSSRKLEQVLIDTFEKLNKENSVLDEVACPTIPRCQVIFELGIAEGNHFNYLDLNEERRVLAGIEKTPLEVMDFFCCIRYYKEQNGKKRALRFDYYLLRFRFSQKQGLMQVFHEKGPRYITPEDLATLLARKVNAESGRKILTAP